MYPVGFGVFFDYGIPSVLFKKKRIPVMMKHWDISIVLLAVVLYPDILADNEIDINSLRVSG
jgi:hypothetical protein